MHFNSGIPLFFLGDNMKKMIIALAMMSFVPLCAMEKEQSTMLRPTHVAPPGCELVCYPNHVQIDEKNLPEGAKYRGYNIVQIPEGMRDREYMKKIHPIIVDPERSTEFTVFVSRLFG
jgi:hypothetical protein